MDERIGLVVVAYGDTSQTLLDLVREWGRQESAPQHAYVVANSPVADTSALARCTTVLEPTRNLGFTGGVNLGARAAAADGCTHLLLSNVDVRLLSPFIVKGLLGVLRRHPEAVAVSPGIVMWPDVARVWYRGARLYRPGWIAHHPSIGRRWRDRGRAEVRTGYFSGCCALVDLKRFLALDGFDESLFMYYDEAEFSIRAAARGWTCWVLDEPLVGHEKTGRKFSAVEAYWHARNTRILLARHERGRRRALGAVVQLAVLPLQLGRCESWRARRAYLRGYALGKDFSGEPR